MGVVNSQKKSWNKSCVYSDLLKNDQQALKAMFDMYPKFLNEGIASDMKLPPLGVAAMRGNVELIQFLLKMGADINGVGDQDLTPVMWAVFQRNIRAVECLVKNKCDLTVTTKDTKNSAIDYAILGGNYLMAYYLYMQKVKIRKAEFYYKAAKKRNQRQKIDYPKFLDCLDAKIHPNEAPSSFVIRKKRKVYKDPVIDPNEPWKNWFVRVANFKDPPLVERDSLPENMQPQNRFFGKVHCWINDMNPYPPPHIVREKKMNKKLKMLHKDVEEQKIEIIREDLNVEIEISEIQNASQAKDSHSKHKLIKQKQSEELDQEKYETSPSKQLQFGEQYEKITQQDDQI